MPSKNDRPSSHLDQYLDYYQGLTEPRYAVLVTGPWGSGKTTQVNNAIPEERRISVSLFGKQSADDIFAAVYTKIHPIKGNFVGFIDRMKGAAYRGVPAGAITSIIVNAIIKDEVDNNKTIVFDDLERCKLKASEILGVINHYVEHHKCRVVVIAHDGKLDGELKEQQEKIFGQTIKITPDVGAAYAAFSEEFSHGAADGPLQRYQDDLVALFHQSEVGSLRILRHVMEDTKRIWSCLTKEQREHPEAPRELVRLVAVFNFEVRAGRLNRQDLNVRGDRMIIHEIERLNKNSENSYSEPAFIAAQTRYPTVRFDSNLLSDDLLGEMLFKGIYDCKEISECLATSAYFNDTSPSETPAWKILLEFPRQPDDVAEAAFARMEDEFQRREFLAPGEMLHVFAMRMMMAENGLASRTIEETSKECRAYVDDLRSSGKLSPAPYTSDERSSYQHGYLNYAFWTESAYTKQFQSVFDYLFEQRREIMLIKLPSEATKILNMVENDGQMFYNELNHTAEGDAYYANVPVLAQITTKDFVKSWMRSHPRNWRFIRRGLRERRENAQHRGLTAELPWFVELIQALKSEADKAEPVRALRIRKSILNELEIEER